MLEAENIKSFLAGEHTYPLISIIIPFCNTEKFIGEAVRSVIHSTYPSLECILIDDCSSDQSVSIAMKELKNSSLPYTLLTNEQNMGVSYSRNKGLKNAKGKYVIFLDGDDLLAPSACSLLFQCAKDKEADVVFVERTQFNSDASIMLVEDDTYQKDHCVLHREWLPTAIGALIKKQLLILNHIEFAEDMKNGEDSVFTAELLANTGSTYLYRGTLYGYRKGVKGQATEGLWNHPQTELDQELHMLYAAKTKLRICANEGRPCGVWIDYVRAKKNAVLGITLNHHLHLGKKEKKAVFSEYPIKYLFSSTPPISDMAREMLCHLPFVNNIFFYKTAFKIQRFLKRKS